MTAPISAVAAAGQTPMASAAPAGQTPTASAAPADNSQLSSQAFLKLLVAQLQYQDPSSPADMNAFMTETATLNQLQTMQQLASATNQLAKQQQVTQALALIGKTVSYTAADGSAKTGTVTAVSMTADPPQLQLGQQSVPLPSVSSVLTS